MPDITTDELNTLCLAAFSVTFGKVSPVAGLVARTIKNHKHEIRSDILEHIQKTIEDCKAKDWKQENGKLMDKFCWNNLLEELI